MSSLSKCHTYGGPVSPQEGAVSLHVSGPPPPHHLSSVPGGGEPVGLVAAGGPLVLSGGSESARRSPPTLEEESGLRGFSPPSPRVCQDPFGFSPRSPEPKIIYLTCPGHRGDPPSRAATVSVDGDYTPACVFVYMRVFIEQSQQPLTCACLMQCDVKSIDQISGIEESRESVFFQSVRFIFASQTQLQTCIFNSFLSGSSGLTVPLITTMTLMTIEISLVTLQIKSNKQLL